MGTQYPRDTILPLDSTNINIYTNLKGGYYTDVKTIKRRKTSEIGGTN